VNVFFLKKVSYEKFHDVAFFVHEIVDDWSVSPRISCFTFIGDSILSFYLLVFVDAHNTCGITHIDEPDRAQSVSQNIVGVMYIMLLPLMPIEEAGETSVRTDCLNFDVFLRIQIKKQFSVRGRRH